MIRVGDLIYCRKRCTFALALNRLVSILFFLLYLFTTTEFSQVLKVPILFEHYQEHKLMNPRGTLLGFFQEHYFNGGRVNPDYTRDMQLPFKSHSQCQVNFDTISPGPETTLGVPGFHEVIITFDNKVDSLPSAIHFSIWQPPEQHS